MKTLALKLPSVIRLSPILLLFIITSLHFQSCDEDGNLLIPDLRLTEAEVAQGLREALKVGTNHSVEKTNTENGFYGNALIKIPWPEDALFVYNNINNYEIFSSLRPYLSEIILLMNRAAENASVHARDIFISAITGITIQDAWSILNGEDDAATLYLYNSTSLQLHSAFIPDITHALESVGAAAAWDYLASNYNSLANSTPWLNLQTVNTDLPDYTTTKALDGLFLLIAEEELKIRTEPSARINDILKRVFGSLD